MAVFGITLQVGEKDRKDLRKSATIARRAIATAAAATAMLLQAPWAYAQAPQQGRLDPNECLKPGEPLYGIPELISNGGKLQATIRLRDELRRLTDTGAGDCALVYLRYFEGVGAVAPPVPPPPRTPPKYVDPVPGPTLRARVGEVVQLTFVNQVNPLDYAGTIDRGENAGACDQFTPGSAGGSGYPASVSDTFPDCFHGSSTANIHFHGTHTNPNSTGDNVFLNIRPSPRSASGPIVTDTTYSDPFKKFFDDCETRLKADALLEWPRTWSDAPSLSPWTQDQEKLLKAYDAGTTPYSPPPKAAAQQIWPPDKEQLDGHLWPQYYIGAVPYCFLLPEYKSTAWPPGPSGVKMGQAPGTHWYHAHKHGSTAINVSNGMTGVFIIEGKYDDDLNAFYGKIGDYAWTRAQPVLVINQMGNNPNLVRGAALGPQGLSVNGRLQPKMSMQPGQVQFWRIANTSSRSAVFFLGPPKADPTKKDIDPKTDFQWRQLAQDGVQFADVNYQRSENAPIMVSPGNRIDLLVRAPTNPKSDPYDFKVVPNVSRASVKGAGTTLLSVAVSGTPPANPRQTEFIPKAPILPPFLEDITDDEVKYTPKRTFVFDSKAPGQVHQHTINGQQFSDTNIGVTVSLNTVEEWKVVNTTNKTTGPGNIDHPFHIHINPFQIVEVFDPFETITDPKTGQPLDKYVLDKPTYPDLQCQLNLSDPDTWKDCHNKKQRYGIWWDVFPIPTGRTMGTNNVLVPGFFRMRSRFVDYPGLWVIHCHILAHEDRGMMTIVQVAPVPSATVMHH